MSTSNGSRKLPLVTLYEQFWFRHYKAKTYRVAMFTILAVAALLPLFRQPLAVVLGILATIVVVAEFVGVRIVARRLAARKVRISPEGL